MGMRLKRCQVVGGHGGGGRALKGEGGARRPGEVARAQSMRGGRADVLPTPGADVEPLQLPSYIFSDRAEERSAEETSERAKSPKLITQNKAPV